MPSVLYMIFRPVRTEDVSSCAALCAFRVVEGDEVEISRLCEDGDRTEDGVVECFDVDAGERVAFGLFEETEVGSLC